MSQAQANLPADVLQSFAAQLLCAAGVYESEAVAVAESLVDANLRGHDSHGVMRVREYVGQLRSGDLKPGAGWIVLQETASVLVVDADCGFGQVQMRRLIEELAPKAHAQGVACGTLRRSGHVGRLGEWVERVAERGLAGMVTVNDNGVLQCVAPPGGTAPRISTNPLAIAVPSPDGPLSMDISTSAVANGKIQLAALEGREVPPGWLQDAQGVPTTDPHVRRQDPPGSLLPMGGEQGYKGFALGLFLDLLVGGLSGGWCPPAEASAELTNNVLLVIWDPEKFAGSQHFVGEVSKLVEHVRSTPRKAGVERIRLPGDRSQELQAERLRTGIPLDAGTRGALAELAGALNVTPPSGW